MTGDIASPEREVGSEVDVPDLLSGAHADEVDQYTGTTARGGNTVLFLPSGASSYEQRWKLIAGARHRIDLVTFSLMRDGTTRKLRDLLLTKLKEGVTVRMIVDDAVVYSTFVMGWLDELARAGATVLRYHKVFRDLLPELGQGRPFKRAARIVKVKIKRRFHEKYTIVDGEAAILGGINWGDKYAFGGIEPKAWRDSDVLLTGPVVRDIQRQFERDVVLYTAMDEAYLHRDRPGFDPEAHLRAAHAAADRIGTDTPEAPVELPTPPATGSELVRYIPHKPYDEQKLRMTEAVLLMIRRARRYIYWGCHGIRPPRILAEHLAAAVERGVDVRLITNSQHASKTLMFFGLLGWMYWESSNHFPWLLEHGIRVFEWQKPGAFHSKNLVIDDAVASVGSYNIARGSTFHHTESNVVVYGGDFPILVRKQFEIDFGDCKELEPWEGRRVPLEHQPMRRILHERNLLIPRELRTEAINRDLDAGLYKVM